MAQPKKAGTSGRRSTPRRPSAPDEQHDEDALLRHVSAVRELLLKRVVDTGDRIQEIMDEAVKRGRMTRYDAEELVQSLVQVARKQSMDVLAELESLVGRGRSGVDRSAEETRARTRARVSSVATAARRAPGTDRALREVDRVRRAAGVGGPFPITGYDDLTAAQVSERLADLTAVELRKVRDHERRNANRKSVLAAVEKHLGSLG